VHFLKHEKRVIALLADEIMGVWGMLGIVLAGGFYEMFKVIDDLLQFEFTVRHR